MMGASLNPQSDMAKEMDSVLKAEVQAHSVFDPALQPAYHGVPLPGSKRNRAAVRQFTSGFRHMVLCMALSFPAKIIHLQLVSGGEEFTPARVSGRAAGTPVGAGKSAAHGSS